MSEPTPPSRPALHELVAHAPVALLHLATFEPPEQAVAIVASLLTDGRWVADPVLVALAVRGKWNDHAAVLGPALEAAMTPRDGEGFTAHHAELLPTLVESGHDGILELVAARYSASAGPGDARLGLSLLSRGLPRTSANDLDSKAGAWALPIASALVRMGGAEIGRQGIDVSLLRVLVLAQGADPSLLVAAFQHLAAGGQPDPLGAPEWGTLEQIFSALDTALSHGLPGPIACDLLPGHGRLARAHGNDTFFGPLGSTSKFPALRAAMLRGLAAGVWRDFTARDAWRIVLTAPATDDLTFTVDGVEAALMSFVLLGADDTILASNVTGWVSLVMASWFREFGLRDPTSLPALAGQVLPALGFFPHLAQGVARALRQHALTADAGRERDVTLQLLDASETRSELVTVALYALPSHRHDVPWKHGLDRESVSANLTHVLVRLQGGEVADAGLAAALVGLSRVVVRDTPEALRADPIDALVWRDGDVVVAEGIGVYKGLCGSVGGRDRAVHACAIYFIHELIHVLQGIQAKRYVTALRAAASEHTLGHLDLEADHRAAQVVSAALGVDLIELKELEGQLIHQFPATFHHTHASIARKSTRLLGLRLDVILRGRAGFGIALDEDGYAFVEVPRARGVIVFMWTAGLRRVVATARISQTEADWLSTVALGVIDLAEVDEALTAMLERAEIVSNRL